MDRDTQKAVLILLGLHILLSESEKRAKGVFTRATAAAMNSGARLYDALHNDSGHGLDLPGPRMPPEAILALATMVGFPDPKLAAAVAMGESLGYTGAVNHTSREYSVGLWQINTMSHPYTVEDMREPMKNAQAAVAIYKRFGWQPWGAYTNGRYKQFQKGVLA